MLPKRVEFILILLLTLFAFGLRLWQLDGVPPGWRDDELINSLVISQKVLDGDLKVYYADASGHEALYHALNAFFLGVFGANMLGIRLLSVFLGTLTVPMTWLLGRKLFGSTVGLLAAAALALSFWSLMYSRIGIRHILMPVTTLLAFYFFWRGLQHGVMRLWGDEVKITPSPVHPFTSSPPHLITSFLLAGLAIGLGFYVYFASRGVPLILLAFCLYLLLVARPLLKKTWRGIVLMFVLAGLLALPLFITLSRQPESEARVDELAVPVIEARQGNFEPLQKHVTATLSMFHNDGDDEWLYNIPHRAVFGPLVAIFFWLGVFIAAFYALKPFWQWIIKRGLQRQTDYRLLFTDNYTLPSAFLLIWWLAGISPGFISVPPASLGHTILAQPVTFMLLALPVGRLGNSDLWSRNWRSQKTSRSPISNLQSLITITTAIILLISIARRDFPDYWGEWPQRGMVRFLYRAELGEVADYVNQNEGPNDFSIAGLLAGPWDKLALQMELGGGFEVLPRWFNPERAVFLEPALNFTGYPEVPFAYEAEVTALDKAGAYTLGRAERTMTTDDAICFQNGLCVISADYDAETGILELGWWASRALDLPYFRLISNPPPPGVDTRPRLHVFAQLLAAGDQYITGDDGLWVDPYSVRPGDIFIQQHYLPLTPDVAAPRIVYGLYDPQSGKRLVTDDHRDQLVIELGE